MQVVNKENLPQGGTGRTAVGESTPVSNDTGCPSYSGGGNLRLAPSDAIVDAVVGDDVMGDEVVGDEVVGDEVVGKNAGDVVAQVSDSEMSVKSASSGCGQSRFFRKRRNTESPELSSATDEDNPPQARAQRGKRGRGRPPTTGECIGLGKAREALQATRRAEFLKVRIGEEDRQLAEAAKKVAVRSERAASRASTRSEAEFEPEDLTAGSIEERLNNSVAAIRAVGKMSKGLKGTAQKTLKDAAASIEDLAHELMERCTSSETRRLQAENARLKQEMADLRQELDEIRTEVYKSRRSAQPETEASRDTPALEKQLTSLLKEELGRFREEVLTKVNFLEGKVLRPTLASDRGSKGRAPTMATYAEKTAARPTLAETPVEQVSQAVDIPPSQPSTSTAPAKTKKAKRKKAKSSKTAPDAAAAAAPQKAEEGAWQTVGQKMSQKKATRKEAQKKKRQEVRLRPPRSAAVVLTLQPHASQNGVTYEEVLGRAKSQVDTVSLGIEGMRCKVTATGARLLQVPGSSSGPLADALADKLRQALNPEEVKVSRPVKRVDLRISGLDDSVTREELTAALAKAGACSELDLKVGEIRRAPRGMGTSIVACPVTVAKKLEDGRRLLVGWVSASVKLLKQRPMRCYRCITGEHVATQCNSVVDCSGLCFRCGKRGHEARTCSAAPHCPVCAEANKPADHAIGSKLCKAANNKTGKTPKKAPASRPKIPPTESSQGVEPFEMECP
ncbi:uncharacterized protein LOC128677305 [Plodia interpunctella]|uniref:uncharacterized protein LOC128677305 n=1 Tax=Plodia interpunctella TaxID=58824 RepID=UPI00236819B6|nr:uncharacterized protein LOC128677305 [Plodia interpunctella]